MAFTRDSEQRNNRDEQEEKFHGVLPTGQVWKCNFNLPGFQAIGVPRSASAAYKPNSFSITWMNSCSLPGRP
jgi:hypothetical protein